MQVDVRIVAATNKDIETLTENGAFRKDLYYRLNVLPIYIPPLRERRDDIPLLADFFLSKLNRETKKRIKGFTDEAMDMLLSYSWPGNVRELENAIERAVVITQDRVLDASVFSLGNLAENRSDSYVGKTLKDAVNLFKKHFIRNALESNGWQQTKTAKNIGIQRTYLSKLIRDLQITR